MGQTRTLRNKLRNAVAMRHKVEGEDGLVAREKPLEIFNSIREDVTKRGQTLQRHPTKGDRPISIKRARAQATMAAILDHQPGAANLATMREFIKYG